MKIVPHTIEAFVSYERLLLHNGKILFQISGNFVSKSEPFVSNKNYIYLEAFWSLKVSKP